MLCWLEYPQAWKSCKRFTFWSPRVMATFHCQSCQPFPLQWTESVRICRGCNSILQFHCGTIYSVSPPRERLRSHLSNNTPVLNVTIAWAAMVERQRERAREMSGMWLMGLMGWWREWMEERGWVWRGDAQLGDVMRGNGWLSLSGNVGHTASRQWNRECERVREEL